MNRSNIYKVLSILAFMALTITPFTAHAGDIWEETPGLFDNTEHTSAVSKPNVFIYKRPPVNMWAETPDLNAEAEDYDVVIDNEARFVDTFFPEMYVETPVLNEIIMRDKLLKDVDSLLAGGR